MWAVLRPRKLQDHPDLPLLSVYREHGVVPKDSRDDNHNRAGLDLSVYQVVRPGEVVMNKMKAWQGSVAVSDFEGIVSPDYMVLELRDRDVNPRFLHYLLRSRPLVSEYRNRAYGVRPSQWRLMFADFRSIKLDLPSERQQSAIADFLDRKTTGIDALIEKKRKLLDLLAEKRAALINQAVTKGLDPTVPMKDSGIPWIGQIPVNWAVRPLGYAVRFSSGSTPSKAVPEYWDGGVPWVSPKDMKQFRIADSADHVTSSALAKTSLALVPAGTTLVVVRGMILARTFPVALTATPVTINQDMKALHTSPGLNSEYLAWQLRARTQETMALVAEAGHGTKALRTDLFSKLPLLVPNLEEQGRIVQHLESLTHPSRSPAAALRAQLNKLLEYRQALITAAVTGQLDVGAEEAAA